MEESHSSFKVIIVGAGVTGLTLAHCLAKANIDFVLLDKGVVAPIFGTTITLQPHGCRVLRQLGCLDAVLAPCDVMGGARCRDSSGKSFASNDFFGVAKKLYVFTFISAFHIVFAWAMTGKRVS
jgi:flavin-dependent dehydrogenase